jgi:hypothetical protein
MLELAKGFGGFAIQADAPVAGLTVRAIAPSARVAGFTLLSLTLAVVGVLMSRD